MGKKLCFSYPSHKPSPSLPTTNLHYPSRCNSRLSPSSPSPQPSPAKVSSTQSPPILVEPVRVPLQELVEPSHPQLPMLPPSPHPSHPADPEQHLCCPEQSRKLGQLESLECCFQRK